MFVKLSLCDRLLCLADFFKMTLLAVLLCYHHPIVFSEIVLRHSFQLSGKFSYHQKHLQFLARQIPKMQHLHVLLLRQFSFAKMDVRFPKQFVQLHQIPVHVVGQNFYRLEPLLVLTQPSCNDFQVTNECWTFS